MENFNRTLDNMREHYELAADQLDYQVANLTKNVENVINRRKSRIGVDVVIQDKKRKTMMYAVEQFLGSFSEVDLSEEEAFQASRPAFDNLVAENQKVLKRKKKEFQYLQHYIKFVYTVACNLKETADEREGTVNKVVRESRRVQREKMQQGGYFNLKW